MRKKMVIVGLGIAVAASAAVIVLIPGQEQASDGLAPVQHQPQVAHTAENPLFTGLPARRAIGPSKGELFSSPPRPKPPAPIVSPVPIVAPAPPSAPPMPYRFAGRVVVDGVAKVVLAKGDRVFAVQPGERLDGGYRVDAIGPDEVALVYEPLGIRELLALSAPNPGAVATPPAGGFNAARANALGGASAGQSERRVQSGAQGEI